MTFKAYLDNWHHPDMNGENMNKDKVAQPQKKKSNQRCEA